MTSKQPGKSAMLQEIDDLMLSIRKHLNKSLLLTSTKKLPMIPQPKCLIGGQLKEYQLQSLSWMVELANNNLSGILADDMGLGKTIQAIAYMSYLYETKGVKGKHLIVVPKNVLNNWKRELQTWNPMFRVVVLPGTEVEREQCIRDFIRPSKFDILIVTFQSVQTAERNLKPFCWETFIVDEAHSIKNDQTFLASCLRRFNYKFTLLLTGTPLSNELKELWSLLNFIAPKIFFDGNLFKKIENSVNLECKDQQQKLKYQSEIAAKFKAIISPFLMRRVKSEINLGLKEKKEFTLFISLSDLQLKMYRNYLKYNSVYGAGTGFQMSRQMQLRKICSHPYLFSDIQDPKEPPFGEHLIQNCGKMKLLDKLLNKLLKENHKILIFSQFTIFLKVLEDYCAYREYKYATITGQSSLEDRDGSVEIFSKSKDINLFLISTRAGGIGLNLVAADVVILYDLDWNPQMDRQATDRAYRIGQKNSVKVFKLISINTVEERMLEVQKYKIIWDELVIQKGGLARLKAAQEKLQKLDQNKIAGLDAEEIFKLQQNFDDKTIDEIIMMGEQKDKKKTQQIKAKLEKEFQKLGQIANPFQDLQKGGTKLGDIQYQAERLGHGKQKSKGKLTWKERVEERNGQMMLEKELKTKPYHFFTDEKRALEILKSLKGTEDQKVKDQCQKELRRLGFYDWSRTQFEAFVRANQIHFKEDYKSIAKEIGTKNAKEVLKYSEEYYNKADQIPALKKELKKIMKKQQEFQKNIKIKEAEDKIKAYPDHLFNFKAKYPIQEVSFHSVNRMYYNGIKSSGICLQEQENILSILNPVALAKVNQKHATLAAKFHSFTKLVNHLESKSQEKVEQELQKRYEALKKIYLPSMSKKITQKQVEEDEESAQTAVKPLYG